MITILGLGPGGVEGLPAGALELISQAGQAYVRTERHPVVGYLRERGAELIALDHLYEASATFEEVYARIVETLMDAAGGDRDVVYAVPGHPMVAEQSVRLLLEAAERKDVPVEVRPAPSFLDAIFAALRLDPSEGLEVVDALSIHRNPPAGRKPAIVAQVYDRRVASDVKLALMEIYPDDHPVTVVRAAGIPGQERLQNVPLHEVDHLDWIDHLTSLCLAPLPEAPQLSALRPEVEPSDGGAGSDDCAAEEDRPSRFPLDPLMEVVFQLRSPGGCPWDREQTHTSLRPYLIEEAFEVVEAIDTGEMNKLREEMGDLLLQIALHSAIAQESGIFTINDVVAEIVEKMIRRHPHVFGDARVSTSGEVLRRWEDIKTRERGDDPERSVLAGIPPGLPALMQAYKLQKKAARVGFDWERVEDAWAKAHEEMRELEEAYREGQPDKIVEELGDLLFAVVNVSRFLKVEPEGALAGTIQKFTRRFRFIEEEARKAGRRLSEMTLGEMDELWNQAKLDEAKGRMDVEQG